MFGGMDTHNDTLAVALVSSTGRSCAAVTVPITAVGHVELADWLAEQGPVTRWGIEGAGGYGRAVALALRDRGVVVAEVPPALTRRERHRARQAGKSDPVDAIAIARVTAREDDLPPLLPSGLTEDLKLLVDYCDQLVGEPTRPANRAHADLAIAHPGYQSQCRDLRSRPAIEHAHHILGGADDVRSQLLRRRLARLTELAVDEIRALERRVRSMVEDSKTRLTQLRGIGGLVAARIMGELGDIPRLGTTAKFVAANGTAPMPASSGRTQRHRLRRGGNRQPNRAIYIAAITQARSEHHGREYLVRKQREGKVRREAIRCLKRRRPSSPGQRHNRPHTRCGLT